MTRKKSDQPQADQSFDPTSLEGLDGIGAVTIQKLRAEQIYTGLDLVFRSATWLHDVTGMDREKAAIALKQLRTRLEQAGYLSAEQQTATQLLGKRKNIKRLQLGCHSFDMMLIGGFEFGAITEIWGENGSGKTQISHTLAVQVITQDDNAKVLYIDTENTFRPERIIEILAARGFISQIPAQIKKKLLEYEQLTQDETTEYEQIQQTQSKEAEKFTERIIVQRAINAYDLYAKVEQLFKSVPSENIKLVILDSGVAPFRTEYLGRGNIKAKFDLLNQTIDILKKIPELYNIVVIFVNQIYHKPDLEIGKDPDHRYGGNIVGHAMTYSIKLWKSGRKHKARIIKSPYQDKLDCEFQISEKGIVDL